MAKSAQEYRGQRKNSAREANAEFQPVYFHPMRHSGRRQRTLPPFHFEGSKSPDDIAEATRRNGVGRPAKAKKIGS